jgi:hypothetical protein
MQIVNNMRILDAQRVESALRPSPLGGFGWLLINVNERCPGNARNGQDGCCVRHLPRFAVMVWNGLEITPKERVSSCSMEIESPIELVCLRLDG